MKYSLGKIFHVPFPDGHPRMPGAAPAAPTFPVPTAAANAASA